MDKILAYIEEKYNPLGIVIYGSYANGTNNKNSDFDAMVIYDGETIHDHSIVHGIELDLFLYSKDAFSSEYSIEDFLQVWDGKILKDELGILHKLQEEANQYILNYPKKTKIEKLEDIAWLEKMLKRIERWDTEGYYRMHWLLVDSLEIYFDIRDKYFFGPKKSLLQMQAFDSEGYFIYREALENPTIESIHKWINHISKDVK